MRYLTIMIVFLFSCTPRPVISNKDKSVIDSLEKDTLHQTSNKTQKNNEIEEPCDFYKVQTSKSLDFTSSSVRKEETLNYCEDLSKGFYGQYTLIDKRRVTNTLTPIVGYIDIFKEGAMSNWRFSDKNQKIWKIHLSSNLLTLWDSIKVGLPRQKIIQFGKTHNGICDMKGEQYYSCDFSNFSAVFIFENDTLQELTVTRKCKEIN